MNLNELNKIEEGVLSSIKGMFTGQGGYQTQVQDIFIKDFVQDALTSLNNGVKGGLIDPNIKTAGATTSTSATSNNNANDNASGGQQYMGKVAPNAGPATKPAAPASPFATPTLNQKPTTVSTTPGTTSKPGDITKGGINLKVAETSYDKMNRVFESIINIDEATQARTVADFMMDWFTQYMQGVEWSASKPMVQQKLEQLQKEYPNNVKQNLTNLARIGLALSKAGSPAGAPQEFAQAKKDQASSVEDLKSALDGLSKSDPKAFNELIKNLKPVQTGFFSEDTK